MNSSKNNDPEKSVLKKQKKREWYKKYCLLHGEKERARKRKWYKSFLKRFPEKEKIRKSEWIKSHPEKRRLDSSRRRAKKKNCCVWLTEKEKQQILILEKTKRILRKETGIDYHIDHILPIVHGGIHHPINLRILEGKENCSKNGSIIPEAVALAFDHYRLYADRVGVDRANEFVHQLAKGLRISTDELNCLLEGKSPPKKTTLENFFT